MNAYLIYRTNLKLKYINFNLRGIIGIHFHFTISDLILKLCYYTIYLPKKQTKIQYSVKESNTAVQYNIFIAYGIY